jgi:hypothetical protein
LPRRESPKLPLLHPVLQRWAPVSVAVLNLGCSAVPAQFMEELVDDVQFAGADHLVIDVLAHRMAAQKICRSLGIGSFPQVWSYLGSQD